MIGDGTCAATTRACAAPLVPYRISAVPTMSLFSGSLATVPMPKPRAASSTLVGLGQTAVLGRVVDVHLDRARVRQRGRLDRLLADVEACVEACVEQLAELRRAGHGAAALVATGEPPAAADADGERHDDGHDDGQRAAPPGARSASACSSSLAAGRSGQRRHRSSRSYTRACRGRAGAAPPAAPGAGRPRGRASPSSCTTWRTGRRRRWSPRRAGRRGRACAWWSPARPGGPCRGGTSDQSRGVTWPWSG